MRAVRSQSFLRSYALLPPAVRTKVDRQVIYLSQNIRHPGVHARKMDGVGDIWEGRVDQHYRFTFEIDGDTVVFRRVGTHAILKNP